MGHVRGTAPQEPARHQEPPRYVMLNESVTKITINNNNSSWWRGTVVERRSLAGELSLSCARPAADG